MARVTVLFLMFLSAVSWYLFPASLAIAGSITCHQPYTMVLDGSMTEPIVGVRQTEHMVLEKVKKKGGLNGRWKIKQWDIRSVYPWPSAVSVESDLYVPIFGTNMSMKMHMSMRGNELLLRLVQSDAYLDVWHHKIGSRKTNEWVGKISGDRVTLQFVEPNKLRKEGYLPDGPAIPSTPLKGHVYLSAKREGSVRIVVPAQADRDLVFSRDNPGLVRVRTKARITPGDLGGNLQWQFDDIEGSQVSISPAPGNVATLEITGLPSRVDQFGAHKLRVKFTSDDGQCSGEDAVTLRLFYPAFARNNPGNRNGASLPNWFYYWKQTPAARPHGQNVRLAYGDRNRCNCNQDGVVACYQTFSFNKLLYLCDLSRPSFASRFQITYPLLDRTRKPPLLGWRTTRYIDTFAVALIHEYQHYLDEIKWVDRRTKKVSRDQDQDWIPDDKEPALKFDPKKHQTYQPLYEQRKPDGSKKKVPLDVGGDEEWLAYEAMRRYKPGTYKKYDWGCPGSQIDPGKCSKGMGR